MAIRVVDGPTAEPVGLGEAKAWLKLETDDEDALVAGLIRSAREYCEAFVGQVLIATRFLQTVKEQPAAAIPLARTPLRAIVGVSIRRNDGVLQPVVGGAYALNEFDDGAASLRVTAPVGSGESVEIDYWAGMAANWNGVPEALRQGILRLVAHLHAHRDAPDEAGPPLAVAALWRPYRRMRLT